MVRTLEYAVGLLGSAGTERAEFRRSRGPARFPTGDEFCAFVIMAVCAAGFLAIGSNKAFAATVGPAAPIQKALRQ